LNVNWFKTTKMTQRKLNILDKIGNWLPGYNGYVIREEKRNDDKKLRDVIANNIATVENKIIHLQQSLIKNNEIQLSQEWEISRKALNTIYSKIKNATYGESSFFSNEKIGENELDEIHNIDLELAERTDIINTIVAKHIEEVMSPVAIIQQIRSIDELLQKREQFMKNYK
jgi:hypothetical protein